MSSPVSDLPQWLASCLVSDRELAHAYEVTAPALLALCKHTLAMQHAFFGEAPDREEVNIRRCAYGIQTRVCTRPVDWALVIFDADYASAPRLVAAVMPALLARVPLVLCVCTPGPVRSELLCALELAGQEHIYVLGISQSLDLVHCLVTQRGQGRLVLLHRGTLSVLHAAAAAVELPCWEERRAPVLRICGPELDAALIRLAHPDTVHGEDGAADAMYCSCPDDRLEQAPLVFQPGMEGCWLHPSLTLDFFRARDLVFGPDPRQPEPK